MNAQEWRLAFRPLMLALITLLIFSSVFSLTEGAVDVDWQSLWLQLIDQKEHDWIWSVMTEIRAPRIFLGAFAGVGMAIAGAALQALFRNPLADPGLIGIGSGAALGAVSVIVLGSWLLPDLILNNGHWILPISAFCGALLVTFLVYQLARQGRQTQVSVLLLGGVAINAIIGVIIGSLTYISDDQQLRELTFWSMGSLASADWQMILPCIFLVFLSLFLLISLNQDLNRYQLGEAEARHLGVDISKVKRTAVICAALSVGAVTAVCGQIGFVGLVVPHLARFMVGPDMRVLLPVCAATGALLLVLADTLSRLVVSPAELPIGLVTSAIGGPFFLSLLLRQRYHWS